MGETERRSTAACDHTSCRVVAVLLLLPTVGGLGGCDEGGKVQRASLALAERLEDLIVLERDSGPSGAPGAFGATPCPPGDLALASAGSGARLYVDATQSMAGYTGPPTATTEFDNILDLLAVDLQVTEVTLFGVPSVPEQHLYDVVNAGPALHQAGTYNRLNNPDYCLFQAIPPDPTPLHVYVTDGVQSAQNFAVPSPTVRALLHWLEEGHALTILAFRSRFSGQGWSESLKSWIAPVFAERRPFYAFLLGRDQDVIDDALERFSPALVERATVLRFTGLQVESTVVTCWISDSTAGPWLGISTDTSAGISCGVVNSGSDLLVLLVGGIPGWWFLATAAAAG